ncbi:MAG: hypothetical protein BM557_05310 [Flavobacterium sp. MedPE-SWcel]|uniref:hypothetical protein n=1 Tax=uncultured Flavobacterium sp. TaxID=165435 RepID=UPI000914E7D2|nr:hypothetical protein [uncultured Flavobacterium sp.]OIQ20093.1 MAG: hypothetical protein BM557_05310 [Flavobacterium sp. MedPE-SWcel]
MNRILFITLLSTVFIVLSCENKKESSVVDDEVVTTKTDTIIAEKDFEMYEMSEMASLMEQMYADNEHLKQRIINGDTIGDFPKYFLEIHSSVMTDETDNDEFFKDQAAKFLEAQKLIYNDSLNAKKHFNDVVSACVRCHEQKCGGPIPRIKKLYIK